MPVAHLSGCPYHKHPIVFGMCECISEILMVCQTCRWAISLFPALCLTRRRGRPTSVCGFGLSNERNAMYARQLRTPTPAWAPAWPLCRPLLADDITAVVVNVVRNEMGRPFSLWSLSLTLAFACLGKSQQICHYGGTTWHSAVRIRRQLPRRSITIWMLLIKSNNNDTPPVQSRTLHVISKLIKCPSHVGPATSNKVCSWLDIGSTKVARNTNSEQNSDRIMFRSLSTLRTETERACLFAAGWIPKRWTRARSATATRSPPGACIFTRNTHH